MDIFAGTPRNVNLKILSIRIVDFFKNQIFNHPTVRGNFLENTFKNFN